MQHIMRLLTDVHSVMNGKPSTLATLPIADVPAVFTLPTGYRPEQLWRQLGLQPATPPAGVRVAINRQFATWDAKLVAGDELAFLPPISGG